MYILGISSFYHDSAACLIKDGQIVAAAQEERFSRVKHDPEFPARAARWCLERTGIGASDLELVAFYDKPLLKFDRLLQTYLAFAPRGIGSFLSAMPLWLGNRLWIPEHIRGGLDFDGRIVFPLHHQSHAASTFFASPFSEAAFLTMDGVGEWTTTSFGTGRGNRLEFLGEQRFPHSLGLLYSAFTYFTGFRVNSGEYKLMGLAPYGEPVYAGKIRENLIDVRDDGSFRLNLEYFDYCTGLRMTNRRFDALFGGPARKPEAKITRREMDLARSVQQVCEEVVLKAARHVHRTTGMKNLCLAGGVALNCVANGRLLREGPFGNLWLQPAAGDAGGALGAALFAWHEVLGRPRPEPRDLMRGALLGPEFSDTQIEEFLTARGAPYVRCGPQELLEQTARRIAAERVVGWVQGRMEFGPRALGARSILADARSAKMQQTLNLKIKFREGFRPFAPAVPVERAGEYFDLACPSPYMLLTAQVRGDKLRALPESERKLEGLEKLRAVRSVIPAVTHVDGSARVQTVERADNPVFYDLLKAFDRLTGCPVLINTSFNVRGEPIVCTPQEAYRCFLCTDMDSLVLGSFILDKEGQPLPTEEERRGPVLTAD